MRVWVIKITSKYSKGAIIYWCMKDTKEKAAFLLQILKNTSENPMYGNEKAVNSPFKTAWFSKTFMKTVNFMSYFPNPSKEGTWGNQ